MKSHITRQHVKKQKAPEGAGIVETEEAAIAALDEWDRPRPREKVVEVENEEDATRTEDVIVIKDATGQEGTIEQAVERIKCLEEDLAAKEEVIKRLESELVTSKDLASIAESKAASLEVENEISKRKSVNLPELV